MNYNNFGRIVYFQNITNIRMLTYSDNEMDFSVNNNSLTKVAMNNGASKGVYFPW